MKQTFSKWFWAITLMICTNPLYASVVGQEQYAWEKTLVNIFNSLNGPVTHALAGIAIVISGLAMAFLDLSGGAKRFVQAGIGISVAVEAAAIVSGFLGAGAVFA